MWNPSEAVTMPLRRLISHILAAPGQKSSIRFSGLTNQPWLLRSFFSNPFLQLDDFLPAAAIAGPPESGRLGNLLGVILNATERVR